MDEKIMLFIDAANIFNSIRKMNQKIRAENKTLSVGQKKQEIRIDYLKLITEIAGGRKVIRSYFFDGVEEPCPPRVESFFNALRHQGITVITRPLRYKEINCERCNLFKVLKEIKVDELEAFNKRDDGSLEVFQQPFQKGIDVALVTELLRMAREGVYDTAIVVSGDNDYKNAIECVKSMGMRVEVASFKNALGSDLKEVADKLIFLDNFLAKITK